MFLGDWLWGSVVVMKKDVEIATFPMTSNILAIGRYIYYFDL